MQYPKDMHPFELKKCSYEKELIFIGWGNTSVGELCK